MISLLKQLNYSPPNLKEYQGNNLEVKLDESEYTYYLSVNDHKWTTYNIKYHTQAYEVYSHYYFAKGHCICTGLGFGARESWLLNKDGVSKVTVIENSEEVIEYHKINNPDLYNNIEIINTNASEYKGKCDTLLLDHYEQEHPIEILTDASEILKNIECDTMWFWPLEWLLSLHQQDFISDFLIKPNRGLFTRWHELHMYLSAMTEYNPSVKDKEFSATRLDTYNAIKEVFNLDKLPEISEDLLSSFYFMLSIAVRINNEDR